MRNIILKYYKWLIRNKPEGSYSSNIISRIVWQYLTQTNKCKITSNEYKYFETVLGITESDVKKMLCKFDHDMYVVYTWNWRKYYIAGQQFRFNK